MRTGMRISSPKARGFRAVLIAAMLGMAPLAASTAATPADGALPVEASAAAIEIMPVIDAPIESGIEAKLPETAPAESLPVATSLGSGSASYYASRFHGRRTASGEAFDNGAMTAAHRTLPFGSLVRVTNEANGRSVVVRINDRGPFTRGRLIDVSRAAAEELGLVARGHATVSLELLEG